MQCVNFETNVLPSGVMQYLYTVTLTLCNIYVL